MYLLQAGGLLKKLEEKTYGSSATFRFNLYIWLIMPACGGTATCKQGIRHAQI